MDKEQKEELITILKKEVEGLQKIVDKLQKTDSEDKPQLRHGDYGYLPDGSPSPARLFTKNDSGEIIYHYRSKEGDCPAWGIDKYIILGNIFDDLKRNSEDLERAVIDGFVMEIIGDRICIGGRRFLPHQATEFYQKLGRLLNTARKKANGK